MSHSKGDRRERELVHILDGDWEKAPKKYHYCWPEDKSFAVMRAPASGAATERELPDVLCGNGGVFWAIECKASYGRPIYIDKDEIEDLQYFASMFGAYPLIGARFDYKDWAFFHPNDLHESEKNRRVKTEDLQSDDALEVSDLWTDPLQ